jgi:hypothetical protein
MPSQETHCEHSEPISLRQQVFRALHKNPLLTAKPLCKLLDLDYQEYKHYVENLRSLWKNSSKNEHGSKCSSVHGWRGWTFLPGVLRCVELRSRAAGVGWVVSRARNRWLLWRDRLGRLQWFETGRVNLYVRRPANLGKAYQLICNGFSFTGLVTDVKVLEEVLSGIRFKGAHYVFPTGQRLPRLTIDLFSKSNGVVIKVGDVSHPDSIEVLGVYPDWAERNERLFEQLTEVLSRLTGLERSEPVERRLPDYVA